MKYKKIEKAKFINRPNRFIANVLIDGVEERIHVRNTGRCKELLIPNADLILEDCKDIISRKTRYSLISVYKNDMLINMDSQIPNNVIFNALKENKIEEFQNIANLESEVTFANSRFDLFFQHNNKDTFLEVKGVTLENNGIAMFPDAPTTRGTKHVYEMIQALEEGYHGVIFFLIQMRGPYLFKLNWEMDKEFSEAILLAHKKGVQILAYDSIISKNSISIGKRIDIDLSK